MLRLVLTLAIGGVFASVTSAFPGSQSGLGSENGIRNGVPREDERLDGAIPTDSVNSDRAISQREAMIGVNTNKNKNGASSTLKLDLAFTKEMLLLSYAAYCPAVNLSKWQCKWCGQLPQFNITTIVSNKTLDGFGFLGYHHGLEAIVVSIRGSHSIRNFIEDIRMSKTAVPFENMTDALVEYGFYLTYNSIAIPVRKTLEQLIERYPDAPLYLTGHSLGGAVSTLIALDTLTHLRKKGSLITFGSPRVGDAGFVKAFSLFDIPHQRVTNNYDLVPHLPQMMFGFRHLPTELWERGSNYTECNPNNGEDPKCSNSLLAPTSVSDHLNYMGLYEDCVY